MSEVMKFDGVPVTSFWRWASDGKELLYALGFGDNYVDSRGSEKTTEQGFYFKGRWFASLGDISDAQAEDPDRNYWLRRSQLTQCAMHIMLTGEHVRVEDVQ